MSKQHAEHILAIPAHLVEHRVDGFVDYTLKSEDIIIAERAMLEQNWDYRQVIPVTIITCRGLVFAYQRTPAGGESRLHGGVTPCVGGHMDLADVVFKDSVIDVHETLMDASTREVEEELIIQGNINSYDTLDIAICCDETPVDRLHICFVTQVEVDSESVLVNEDALKSLGFMTPEALKAIPELESWGHYIADILIAQNT